MLKVSRIQNHQSNTPKKVLPKTVQKDFAGNVPLMTGKTIRNLLSSGLQKAEGFMLYLMGVNPNTEPDDIEESKIEESEDEVFKNKLSTFKGVIEEIQALQSIWYLADWDNQTHAMPAKANEYRAWQMSILKQMIQKVLISDEMSSLLEYLTGEAVFNKLNDIDKAQVKDIHKQNQMYKKVSPEVIQELFETTTVAHSVWAQARDLNKFDLLVPYLEKIVSLKQQIAEMVGYKNSPYEVLLDFYEPGMTTQVLDKLFGELKKDLLPIIQAINKSPKKNDNSYLQRQLSPSAHIEIAKLVSEHVGFDLSRGRIGAAAQPFSNLIAPDDVVLATGTYKDLWNPIGTPIHEAGHGLYNLAIDRNLSKTTLYDCSSYGIHESQARLYEAIIGQGLPFWKSLYPKLQEKFPEYYKSISLEKFYEAINFVEPFNQVDEVTYNMHAILRYEIERDLIEGRIQVKNLPKIWDKKMKEYFGVVSPEDAHGVLQDGHWSSGDFGYFPSYALGTLYSIQFYNQAKKEIPDLEGEIAKGNMLPLKNWLGEKIHKYGKLQTPDEIIQRVTGKRIEHKQFIDYIKEKYGKLYAISNW